VALLRADRLERGVLARVIVKAAEYRTQLDERMARLIISELAEATKRGR